MKKVKYELWKDERGQTGAGVLAGAGAAIAATGSIVSNFMSHPITRFLTIESILALDTASALFLNWQGVIGAPLSFLVKGVFGVDVPFESWELLFIYPSAELVLWMMSNGK